MGITIIKSAADARIAAADRYLSERTATFEQRCHRFDCTLEAMYGLGLGDRSTVFDIGAGDGNFGARLHTGRQLETWIPASRARYMPIDACIDGVDLDQWYPPRTADFFVALELLEHLKDPFRLLEAMQENATKGVLISTPNPETTDVLGMDATHVTPILAAGLEAFGFHVQTASFYGQPDDSLFAVWSPAFL